MANEIPRSYSAHLSAQRDQDLARIILQAAPRWKGHLTILAGHFMVLYRSSQQRFVPILRSTTIMDPNATPLEKEYVQEVGDFPEESFDVALDIVRRRGPGTTSILLLVDDHQFRRIQRDHPDHERLKRAREAILTNKNLPVSFYEALKKRNLTSDIFEKPHLGRGSNQMNPLFFSEHSLRRTFSRRTKKWLLRQPGFVISDNPLIPRSIIYESSYNAGASCVLDDENEPTCSAAAMQLMIEIAERGIPNFLLFVPYFCKEQVAAATAAIFESSSLFDNSWLIWGTPPDELGHAALREGIAFSKFPIPQGESQ